MLAKVVALFLQGWQVVFASTVWTLVYRELKALPALNVNQLIFRGTQSIALQLQGVSKRAPSPNPKLMGWASG